MLLDKDPDENDEGPWYINYYHCYKCNNDWEMEWSCTCSDECSVCGRSIMPTYSEDFYTGKKYDS